MAKKIYGVDISHHQNFEKIEQMMKKKRPDFIVLRATVGTSKVDSSFHKFMELIKKTDTKVGFYVASYSKNEVEAIEEANYVCNAIKNYKADLPIFYDWEYFSRDYVKGHFGIDVSPACVQRMTEAFCEQIKKHGYKTGVYYNYDFLMNWYGESFFKAHPDYVRWYARPGRNEPDKPCNIWQYRSDWGTDFGYEGNIDKNIMYYEEPKSSWSDKLNNKIYRSIASNNQYFNSADVNDIVGYLPKGDYKIKSASDKQIDGFDWLIIEVEGKSYYVVILDGRCELIEKDACGEIKKENEELKKEISQLERDLGSIRKELKSEKEKSDKLKAALQSIKNESEKALGEK